MCETISGGSSGMAEGVQIPLLLQGDVYEVEKLVGIKIEEGKKLYKVRWKGYSAQADTYEPEENLLSCKDMIAELEERLEKKQAKKFSKNIQRQTIDAEELSEEGQQLNESDACRDQSKDTFWIDFNAGKINVFGQDMYSKVKERAARAVSQTEGKQNSPVEAKPNDAPVKELPSLALPKVVLKRRTNPKNSVPTYRSSLHLKPVSIGVKKRKKYDVLRDYRRRKYRTSRKRSADENKQLNGNNNELLFQTLKQRTVITLSKSPAKSETLDNVVSSEYLSVLKELPANDENNSNDSLDFTTIPLPTSSPPKILLESERVPKPIKAQGFSTSFKEELARVESRRESYNQPDNLPTATSSQISLTDLNLNDLSPKISDEKKKCETLCKLNVLTTHQSEFWMSMKLKESFEKLLSMEKGSATLNRHMFDLLMAASLQGRLDITEKLCSRGAPLNQVINGGITMIMILSQLGLHDVVKIFLKHKAHKDVQNQYGETALMLACKHKHPKVVKLLLEHGANFALTNSEGINALRVSNKFSETTGVTDIMNEHISRMKLEFEKQTRNLIDNIAEIKYALFPLQCFSLSEGPQFVTNFSHHLELESPGKGGKEFLLFIANCRIKGNRFMCDFSGSAPVSNVSLNSQKQENFKGNNFLFKISCLRTGNNEICISTVTDPESEVKLVVCAYRVHYRRGFCAN